MPTLGEMFAFYKSLAKSLCSLAFARLYKPQRIPTRDLTGQTAIVTGANSGIGLSIAVALARQGAAVYLACRNADRGAAAIDHVVAQCNGKSKARVSCRILDVGDLSSVRTFCQQWKQEGTQIDMLVHNAGIAAPPTGSSTKTNEGLEIMYTTNFLGGYLMTHLLESSLSQTARVVLTSSTGSYSAAAHFLHQEASGNSKTSTEPGIVAQIFAKAKAILGIEAQSSAPAYGLSKAQQVLFASLLQRRFEAHASPANGGTCRTAHAFTPGFTSTPIFGKFDVTWQTWLTNPLFAVLKTTEKWIAVDTDEGARTGVWLATWGDEIGARKDGGAFWERKQKRTSLVDLMIDKRKMDEWTTWERDAEIMWSI
jgi:NAD(P)-dependent dehydrogenase (short-subunit alcohol dehydrogenase family)